MPKIKGLSAKQNQHRDRVAKALLREGKPASTAYAVSAAAEERAAGLKPKKPRKG